MRKLFFLISALAITSFTKAEVYEANAEGNDNVITIAIGETDDLEYIPVDISLSNPTMEIQGLNVYLEFSGGNTLFQSGQEEISETRCMAKIGRKTSSIVSVKGTPRTAAYGDKYYNVSAVGEPTPEADAIWSFQGSDGIVLTSFINGTSLEEGKEYTVTMTNSSCWPNATDRYYSEDMTVTFTVTNGTVTGINSISVDAQNAKYYSVNGAIQNGPQKGVNIVKYADGKVKKVIIK